MYACLHVPDCLSPPEDLIRLAGVFSPLFELTRPDTVVLSLDGLERLFGGLEEIVGRLERAASAAGFREVRVAVAATPDAAQQAARYLPGSVVIPPGQQAWRLGGLAVTLLPLAPGMDETLARWGIRTFADLAALPEQGIAQRFGEAGVFLQRMARGEADRPLSPYFPPAAFEEREELEHPLELLEPLLFVLGRQLHELCARLQASSLATDQLRLGLRLEGGGEDERMLELPVPAAEHHAFLKLLQLDLEARPPRAPVVAAALRVRPVQPRHLQNGLFLPQAPEPRKLEVTLARIAGLVGKDGVGSPELVDTHRPGAFRMTPFRGSAREPAPARKRRISLAIRLFRPPLRASVEPETGVPRRVDAPGVRGRVLTYAGPWRTSGDWWTRQAWRRDEWDVALEDGALYRLYRDYLERAWFVEGRYD